MARPQAELHERPDLPVVPRALSSGATRALRARLVGLGVVLVAFAAVLASCGDGVTRTEWDGGDLPAVGIEVRADSEDGVNIGVTAEGFEVRPDRASLAPMQPMHMPGQGHFRLLVDGAVSMRFYNDWIHVPGVAAGDVEFTVELLRNDGRPYTIDGEPLTASVPFVVPEHSHAGHSHDEPEPVEVAGRTPTLDISVREDADSGFNVTVFVEGLVLDGRSAGDAHVPGSGHLHLYANGQKIARLYGPDAHLPVLPEGVVEITVGAFTNDHRPYVVNGMPVEATTSITVDS